MLVDNRVQVVLFNIYVTILLIFTNVQGLDGFEKEAHALKYINLETRVYFIPVSSNRSSKSR